MSWAYGTMLFGMAISFVAIIFAVKGKIDIALKLLIPSIAFDLIGGIAIWIDTLGGM